MVIKEAEYIQFSYPILQRIYHLRQTEGRTYEQTVLWLLSSARRLMMLYISMKYHENVLSYRADTNRPF